MRKLEIRVIAMAHVVTCALSLPLEDTIYLLYSSKLFRASASESCTIIEASRMAVVSQVGLEIMLSPGHPGYEIQSLALIRKSTSPWTGRSFF